MPQPWLKQLLPDSPRKSSAPLSIPNLVLPLTYLATIELTMGTLIYVAGCLLTLESPPLPVSVTSPEEDIVAPKKVVT